MKPLIFVTFAGIPRPVFLFKINIEMQALFKGERDHFQIAGFCFFINREVKILFN